MAKEKPLDRMEFGEIEERVMSLEKALEQEKSLNASLERYIRILENKAAFQDEIREALQAKIKRLEELPGKR